MKISIITVIYNNASTIAETIDSVLGQDYNDIEYIVIDGESTDGSVDIIRSYGEKISLFVSEKDNGLYDAINKGIRLASGEVVGLLHSDDVFSSTNVISQIVESFKVQKTESIYADLVYVDKHKSEKIVRNWISGKYSKKKFQLGWMPPHPTFYVKRELFNEFGFYDTSFKSAADYELMLRFLYKNSVSTYYLPQVLVRMRTGGESNKSIKNRIMANREDHLAWQKNNLHSGFPLRILKPLIKIPQFFSLFF